VRGEKDEKHRENFEGAIVRNIMAPKGREARPGSRSQWVGIGKRVLLKKLPEGMILGGIGSQSRDSCQINLKVKLNEYRNCLAKMVPIRNELKVGGEGLEKNSGSF